MTGLHCLYVDADACPVKAECVRVAERHGWPVVFVANMGMQLPRGRGVRLEVVSGGFDAADDWIAGRAQAGDVVVTSDIPLAARCLKAGARVLAPSGKPFTGDNIGNALAMRELSADLRAYGMGGGPPPFGPRDRSRFLQELENAVQAARRAAGSGA
jgi:hypothetical protein